MHEVCIMWCPHRRFGPHDTDLCDLILSCEQRHHQFLSDLCRCHNIYCKLLDFTVNKACHYIQTHSGFSTFLSPNIFFQISSFSLCTTTFQLLLSPPSVGSYVWMLTPHCKKQTLSFPWERVTHVGANLTEHSQTCEPTCTNSTLCAFLWSHTRCINRVRSLFCARLCADRICGLLYSRYYIICVKAQLSALLLCCSRCVCISTVDENTHIDRTGTVQVLCGICFVLFTNSCQYSECCIVLCDYVKQM